MYFNLFPMSYPLKSLFTLDAGVNRGDDDSKSSASSGNSPRSTGGGGGNLNEITSAEGKINTRTLSNYPGI